MGTILQSCRVAVINSSYEPNEEDLGHFVAQNNIVDLIKEATPVDLTLPYCCIGFIQFLIKDNPSSLPVLATGVLIMEDLVLTAAHSFFKREDQDKRYFPCEPKSFRFQLHGHYSQKEEFGIDTWRVCNLFGKLQEYCQGDKYFQYDKMLSKDMIGFDYALIKLKRRINNVEFPTLLKKHQIDDLAGPTTAFLYGYPKQGLIYGNQDKIVGAKIKGQTGNILKVGDNYFQHNIQSSYGQSGSPVVVKAQNLGGGYIYYLIGVHAGFFSNGKNKYGVLVSQSMIEVLKLWEDELHKNEQKNCFNIQKIKQRVPIALDAYELRVISQPQQQNKTAVSQKYANPVKYIKDSKLNFEGYKSFHFKFDTGLAYSQYYEVINWEKRKTVKRKINIKIIENLPYHFASQKPFPKQKWKISIRIMRYSQDQFITLGFTNQFRKDEQKTCGLVNQTQCISISICGKCKIAANLQNTGSILIDGDLWIQSQEAFLKEGEVLTIYGDLPNEKMYWVFQSGLKLQTPIPKSVLGKNGNIHFFVGLNNSEQIFEILND